MISWFLHHCTVINESKVFVANNRAVCLILMEVVLLLSMIISNILKCTFASKHVYSEHRKVNEANIFFQNVKNLLTVLLAYFDAT